MVAIAEQGVFTDIEKLREHWVVGANVAPKTLVENQGRVGVTLTGSTGFKSSIANPTGSPYEFTASAPRAGVGNAENAAEVATTGTWLFPVAGATTSTANGTPVYRIAATGNLSTTATGNVLVGTVNYPNLTDYVRTAGKLPVKIGVSL